MLNTHTGAEEVRELIVYITYISSTHIEQLRLRM